MTKSFNDLKEKMSPERREMIEKRAKIILDKLTSQASQLTRPETDADDVQSEQNLSKFAR